MFKIFKNLFILLLLLVPLFTNADTLTERIAYQEVIYDGQIVLSLDTYDATTSSGIMNIFVNPGSQSMNASGLVLNFATSSIEIKAILTGSSFCDFFLENSFDNNLGELRLSGMKPYPGEDTASLLGQVIFEKISEATSTISVMEEYSMILANNGFATNVLASTTSLEL